MLADRCPSARTPAWHWLGLILVIGAGLRFFRLGCEGLWCDEGYTAFLANEQLGTMLRELILNDDAPPLFYLLTRFLVGLFGDGEFALRLLPAAASCTAVLLMLVQARRRREPELFWAAAFFAIASYGVFYARQARSYGLVHLFAFVFILNARDLLVRAKRCSGLWVAISGALLCMTHHLGALLVFSSVPLWLLGPRGRPHLLRWLGWHALPLILWGIYWLFSASQWELHASFNDWMGHFWQDHPLWLAPLLSVGIFAPGGLFPARPTIPFPALGADGTLPGILALAAVLLVLLAGIVGARRSAAAGGNAVAGGNAAVSGNAGAGGNAGARGNAPATGRAHSPLRAWIVDALLLFLPLGALVFASLQESPIYVLGRSDAIAFPAFTLLIGRGLSRLPRWGALPLLLLWAGVSLATLLPTYGWGEPTRAKGTDRRLAQTMLAQGLQPGDWVIHGFLTSPSLEYYLERGEAGHQAAWYPAEAGRVPAGTIATPTDSLRAYEQEAYRLRERMEADLPAQGSVWILGVLSPEAAARRPLGASHLRAAPFGESTPITANDLVYPGGILLYALVGLTPQEEVVRYRQDWIGGERVMIRVPRETWLPRAALSPVQLGSLPQTGRQAANALAQAPPTRRTREAPSW